MATRTLTSHTPTQYYKFVNPGDSITGAFSGYEVVDGKFGVESNLYLVRNQEKVLVRCSSALKKIVEDNADFLKPGVVLAISYTGKERTAKGFEVKKYVVTLTE